ncbi:unnamed protein product, partial [Chrysoparadoxa australica]
MCQHNQVYIGNLGWGTTTDHLKDAFGQYGTLNDAIVIADRETGRSRGFGFATYSSPQEQRGSYEVDGNETKLFVGNLGWDTTTNDLRNAFSRYGNLVDCVVLADRETGQSRGFGFCTYETGREAQVISR